MKGTEHDLFDELKKLYPDLTDEELIAAGNNLDEYVESALVMFERLRHDSAAFQQFLTLTDHVVAGYNETSDLPADDAPSSSTNHLP